MDGHLSLELSSLLLGLLCQLLLFLLQFELSFNVFALLIDLCFLSSLSVSFLFCKQSSDLCWVVHDLAADHSMSIGRLDDLWNW